MQAKIEYHGNKASDAEEVTAEELVRWWSAAHIRPGSHVLVSTTHHILFEAVQTSELEVMLSGRL